MNNPYDPYCKREPEQIEEYVEAAREEKISPNLYVMLNEGTYNKENGHFACTMCYVGIGMPSSPRGWVAP